MLDENIDLTDYIVKEEAKSLDNQVFISEKLQTMFEAIATETIDRKFIVVHGGRGSTKSTSFGGVWANMFSFIEKYRVLYTRFTASSIKASTQLDFEDGMSLMGIDPNIYQKSDYMYTNKKTGGMVLLKGLKSSSNSIEGNNKSIKDFNIWICDEATDIPDFKTFGTISQSIRVVGKKNIVILILNPSHKNHWIYKEFFTKEGIYYDLSYRIEINYTDVLRFLSDDFIREAEEVKLKAPAVYDNIYLGKFRQKVDGVVFDYILKPFPEHLKLSTVYGQDFGYSDGYNATTKVAVDFANKHIYLKEEAYFNRTGVDTMYEIIYKKTQNKLPIIADTAARQTIADLMEKGLFIKWLKKPMVDFSVQKMKDYVIYVDPNSPNLIRELDMYHEKEGVIIRKNDHAIDAARYGFWWLINTV